MNRPRSTLLAASLLLAVSPMAAAEPLRVAYNERPPYTTAQADGSPAGLTGTPASAAFKAAGIPVQWVQLPANRQLAMIKDGRSQSCAIGWFDMPQRRPYSKFTRGLYHDGPWVALANVDFAARGIGSLAQLARERTVRVLVKDNFSYGGLDTFIKRWQPVMAVSTASPQKMAQSVSAGIVDLMFVSEDEGRYIMQHVVGEHAARLRLLQFKDMPQGMERRIMCSKAVPDHVIERLNKALGTR